ncbi:MAG: DUF438 domain-containing protein [bacterium]|nr:DUF438 domain-containing protein [bacterium]
MSELIDNRAHRIRTLKHIIRHLHRGEAPDQVRSQLAKLVGECDATEIAMMEQELMDEGVPVAEVMSTCDLHSQVVRDLLVDHPTPPTPPGHPVDTFRRENTALGATVAAFRNALGELVGSGEPEQGVGAEILAGCRQLFNDLMDVEKHYQRKENLLFSCLERHGISGPSKVMWGKDDEVRELLQALGEVLSQESTTAGEWSLVQETVATPALSAVEEMIYKEEKILLPMALQNLTDTEWGEIWTQSPEFGWCLIEPGEDYEPPAAETPVVGAEVAAEVERAGVAIDAAPGRRPASPIHGSLLFPTGSLTLDQLKLIFSTLPVDLTFVDVEDRVRFFSEGPERIFVRSKAVIGRKVQHCHPPASVDVVDRILDDFRSGRQSVAEFWIHLRGRFVHIRYFALRDAEGEYAGTLEVSQDLTKERALEGERRLLEYG